MTKKTHKQLKIIRSLDEIPQHFESEDAEREFWASHEFSEELYDQMEDATAELDEIAPLPDNPRRSRIRR
jgi:hypothetical protein